MDNYEKAFIQLKPYIFTWNIEGYEIGRHIVKVVTTNDTGLGSESEIEIEIIDYESSLSMVNEEDGNIYDGVEIGANSCVDRSKI